VFPTLAHLRIGRVNIGPRIEGSAGPGRTRSCRGATPCRGGRSVLR
jgi:hypothetical protein